MTYPGGKNGCGSYQRIINHMPPHETYIEGFCGSGAVLRNKKPAKRNIAIDKSEAALELCINLFEGSTFDYTFLQEDTLVALSNIGTMLTKKPIIDAPKTLVYLDPPYMHSTRKAVDLYDYEMTDDDHFQLLEVIASAHCMVMISGYRCELYDQELAHFHRLDYMTQTRQGMVMESLWMNFQPPNQLHDYSFLGSNYRERERIKRKKERFRARFHRMDRLERLAIMEVLTQKEMA